MDAIICCVIILVMTVLFVVVLQMIKNIRSKNIQLWNHFKVVSKHRFWVCYYCFKAGLYWQGLVHDLSKFSPIEFIEIAKYYTGTSSPIDACKKAKGYSKAWLHHKGRNKHHYEYWQDNYDHGTTHLKMPYKYALEMVCDFLGAGRAYSGKKFTYESEYHWWLSSINTKTAINEETKILVSFLLTKFYRDGNTSVLKNKNITRWIKNTYENGKHDYMTFIMGGIKQNE